MKVSVMGVNSFGKLDVKTMLKSLSISYIITFLILIVLSILLTWTPLSINFANIGVILTVCISTFSGGYFVSKKIQSKGFINGAISGLLYVAVLYIIGALLYGKFDFERNMMIMAVVSLLAGSFGGIAGVNAKHK